MHSTRCSAARSMTAKGSGDRMTTAGSTWRALDHRNFVLFFAGQGLSLCGTWMQSLAQSWLIYRLTGFPLLVGLVGFISQVPVVGVGLLCGLLADRWPRHLLLSV